VGVHLSESVALCALFHWPHATLMQSRHQTQRSSYLEAPMHDMQTGAVSALALSFDASCFLSAARDGSLVVVTNGLPGAPSQSPGQPPQLLAASIAGFQPALDVGHSTPSFEEGKQAAVADALAAQAAEARQGLAAEFEALRSELARLIALNAASQPRSEMSIDPGASGFLEGCWLKAVSACVVCTQLNAT